MATEPSRLLGRRVDAMDAEGSDVDAEHEEDVDVRLPVLRSGQYAQIMETASSDVDAEGEEVGNEEDESEPVGAVKAAAVDAASDEDEDIAVESSDAKSSGSEDNNSSSSSESDAENEWEGDSDTGGGAEVEIADPNRCIFCGGKEEDDPSEEFEEYLACAVCGDNAHRQCARNASSLGASDDAERWRCTNCVENGLEADVQNAPDSASRRRSSAPKIARDLLPSHRGGIKSDSHSVFNKLILDDDPMDGSRSLRKRKISPDEDGPPVRSSRKRRRPSDAPTAPTVDFEASSPASRRADRSDKIDVDGANDSASDMEGSQRTRPSRTRRLKKADQPLARIVQSEGISLILAFRLDPTRVSQILSRRPKGSSRRARDRSRRVVPPTPEPELEHYPAISTTANYAPFYLDNEKDETKNKPYGGILSEAEADTSKTFPGDADRKRFELARQKAEEDWRKKTAAAATGQESVRPSKVSGPPSKIKCINFGGWEIDTWHAAPYPEEYSRNRVLYICEFCLKYMNSDYVAWRHKLKCPARHPPGDEIYRDGKYSFFEVDGRKNPVYCQNLCLLAKLFLGSKTLYYDVEPFLFYVMTEYDEFGFHFVGYFSKEKRPSSLNNVSCILVLPIHQRKGFGHMLIDFSYLLTRVEQKTGSPEKPLSDMGLVSYRGYWRLILCYQLINRKNPLSISQISENTGMTADDIISALEGLRALVKDPVTKTYALRLDHDFFREYIDKHERKPWPKINPDSLVWTPYVIGRNSSSSYEEGPHLQTMAPRDGDLDDEQVAPEEGIQVQLAQEAHEQKQSEPPGTTSSTAETPAQDIPTPADESEKPPPATPAPPPPMPSIPSFTHIIYDAPDSDPDATPRPPNTRASATPTPAHQRLHPASTIPPTRFEIFPPLPGAANRRRSNRPFGSRRRNGTQTPGTARRSTPASRRTPVARGGKQLGEPGERSTVRRGRSRLGEVASVVGDGEGEGEDEEEGEMGEEVVVGESPMKGRGKGANVREGVGKLVGVVIRGSGGVERRGDAEAEAEADGDSDPANAEAEGAEEDAEGEGVDMADA
ncbi:hypothetical protein W97_08370 [Coniosporium apollinis CBS 100218]|uniref:Histone acetyltransferase n=1 Tax=Coniosporium apollinis (strain CBS 100218) TaxID=1168221 RepID=R7Z4G9_CONA1|nr:uncharacterized protein W97_08370 [Coniosporium apollinis CBS 100218]EON69057.1 hypothetical protein W97_08370 [Coniosporium apollinis CBS 100218]